MFSPRSSLPENDIVTAISTERDSTAVDRQGSYEELKVMIQELRDENISMKKMLVKILETVSRAPIGVPVIPSAVVKTEGDDVCFTPKKQFEEMMLTRLEGHDTVFGVEQFRIGLMKVIPRYIIKCTEGNRHGCVEKTKISEMFRALLFSVPNDASGSVIMSKAGQSSAFIRRSVIIHCIRSGPNCFEKQPFWLRSKEEKWRSPSSIS